MTSSRKKHQPPPTATTPPAAQRRATSTRDWVVRVLGAVAIIGGGTLALIGVTPGIAGGWGKLAMVVPGMVLVAAGFIAIVETTSMARSRRPMR